MWELWATTLLTSGLDSLNPMAIGQQFILQGMVRKPRDIWYFILPTGMLNFLGGVLFYFGLSDLFVAVFQKIKEESAPFLGQIYLLLAVFFLLLFLIVLLRKPKESEQQQAVEIKGSLSPLTLIMLGSGATLSELATAFPYFAFLGLLINQELSPGWVLLLMTVYNLSYMSPLVLMFVVYVKKRDSFDRFYHWIQQQMIRWKKVLVPLILGGIVLYFFFKGQSMD